MVAELGQNLTTVGLVYMLHKNTFPRIMDHRTTLNLSLPEQCLNSHSCIWEDNIKMYLQEV